MLTRRTGGLLALMLLTCAIPACDETEPNLVIAIGTAQVVLVDSGVTRQDLLASDARLQVSDWNVLLAELSYPGLPPDQDPLDVRFGEDCRMIDTSETLVLVGRCTSGVVIDSSEDAVPMTLKLQFTMNVSRARPAVLISGGGDWDGDGIPEDGDRSGSPFDNRCIGGETDSCDDNCPLLPNPDQASTFNIGSGDRCIVTSGSFANTDNDADTVPDVIDNCVWSFNPDQENTMGLAAEGIPDGIGDACQEQDATVEANGNTTIDWTQTITVAQGFRQTSFLTVDLNSGRALDCNWDSGTCVLDTSQIRLCVYSNVGSVQQGC